MHINNNKTIYHLNIEMIEDSVIIFLMIFIIIFCKIKCLRRETLINNEMIREEIIDLSDEENNDESSTPSNIKINESIKSKNNSNELPSYSELFG